MIADARIEEKQRARWHATTQEDTTARTGSGLGWANSHFEPKGTPLCLTHCCVVPEVKIGLAIIDGQCCQRAGR